MKQLLLIWENKSAQLHHNKEIHHLKIIFRSHMVYMIEVNDNTNMLLNK